MLLNILEQLFSWRVREMGRRRVRDDVRLHNCSTWSESALALRNRLRKLGKGEGCGCWNRVSQSHNHMFKIALKKIHSGPSLLVLSAVSLLHNAFKTSMNTEGKIGAISGIKHVRNFHAPLNTRQEGAPKVQTLCTYCLTEVSFLVMHSNRKCFLLIP